MHAAGTLMVARSNFVYANKRWSSCSTVLAEAAPEKLAKLKQYGLIRRVVMCYPKSSDPQMDRLVQSSFGRTDLSRWRLAPLLSEPVATLPTCEVVAYEVLGIRSAGGEWVMFDGPRLDLPKFDSPGAYERFVMGLIP